MPSLTSAVSDFLLLRLLVPSAVVSESANLTRGAGQGSKCGSATTKKLAATVMPKSDEVIRDRGCRCEGIIVDRSRSVIAVRLQEMLFRASELFSEAEVGTCCDPS